MLNEMSSYSSSSSSSASSSYLELPSICSSSSSRVSLDCPPSKEASTSTLPSQTTPIIYTRRQLLSISPPWSENVRMRLALLDGPPEVISRGTPKEPMAKPIPCPVFFTSRCLRCNDTSAASTDRASLGLILSRRHTTGSDVDISRKAKGIVDDEAEERGRGRTCSKLRTTGALRESSRTRGRERSRSRVPRSRRWTTMPDRPLNLATLSSFADHRMES